MAISRGSDCNQCIHKGVCKFSEGMSEALKQLDTMRASYTQQPFEFEANCRHFAIELSNIK